MRLSDRHIQVLKFIQAHPGLKISDIQRGVNLPLTRRYVHELHGRSLLYWKPSTAHLKLWHPTQKGIEFLDGS